MNEEVRHGIGKRLNECRRSAGLSQTQAAAALGIKSRQTISNWERGSTMPNLPEWFELGKLYGVSLDYMVYGIRTVPVSKYAVMDMIFQAQGVQPQGGAFEEPFPT